MAAEMYSVMCLLLLSLEAACEPFCCTVKKQMTADKQPTSTVQSTLTKRAFNPLGSYLAIHKNATYPEIPCSKCYALIHCSQAR